tara:strand:+ start:908 stop:1201 length:294 start_codon:yes stop_codon:yes gene_type:complete
MKISEAQNFIDIVSSYPNLMEFANIQVLMSLRSVLNRGCKCNKKKKLEQLEQVYKTTILKYKDNDYFNEIMLDYLNNHGDNEISFFSKGEIIASIKI